MKMNRVTLETLARMVKNGFDEVGTRLTHLESGQENIIGHLSRVDGRLMNVEENLDQAVYQYQLVALERRVDGLELSIKSIQSKH